MWNRHTEPTARSEGQRSAGHVVVSLQTIVYILIIYIDWKHLSSDLFENGHHGDFLRFNLIRCLIFTLWRTYSTYYHFQWYDWENETASHPPDQPPPQNFCNGQSSVCTPCLACPLFGPSQEPCSQPQAQIRFSLALKRLYTPNPTPVPVLTLTNYTKVNHKYTWCN